MKNEEQIKNKKRDNNKRYANSFIVARQVVYVHFSQTLNRVRVLVSSRLL